MGESESAGITERYGTGTVRLHELLSELSGREPDEYERVEFGGCYVSWCPDEGCLEVITFDGNTVDPVDHIEPEDVETVGDLKDRLSRWAA